MEQGVKGCRPFVIGKSQPAENHNLSRLISNQQAKKKFTQYLSTPQSSLFSFLVQQYISDLYLTAANWPATLLFLGYPAYSTFIRHCPFHYNILKDIKDHSTSSRNRNRGNRGNIKSRQRGPWRLRLCFLQPDVSLTLPARVSAHAPQLSLSPSYYFLSDLMENTTSKSLLGYL
jgi:hypothetical protein